MVVKLDPVEVDALSLAVGILVVFLIVTEPDLRLVGPVRMASLVGEC